MTQKKAKILVVDDEPGMRKLLSYQLGFLGYETVTAENADEAVLLWGSQGPFDLMITDVLMPGSMDGIDLVGEYRKKQPDQKVILITGYATEEKLAGALQNPLNICFKKPFNIHDLSQCVAECLESNARA